MRSPFKYNAKGSVSVDEIYPQENFMEVAIQDFIKAKSQRDALGSYSLSNRFFYIPDSKHKDKIIYVRGRPSLGSLSVLLIGLSNTSPERSVKNVLLWVSELKLVSINKSGGYAATRKLDLTLADLGQISMSGNYMGSGFGSLQQKPSKRSQKTERDYKINTTINLDKFFPKKWGLQFPMNYVQSERFIEPKYNPLENDLKINEISNELAFKKAVRDYSKSTGYHLNMRKISAQIRSVPRPWDLENFSLFFSYINDLSKDIYKVYQLRRNIEAGLNYSFSFKILQTLSLMEIGATRGKMVSLS